MGCMVHIGVLDNNKKLTEKAKRKFIDEVKDVLKYGTENIPDNSKPKFKCGEGLPPDPASAEALKDLEDEKKFPDFHKNTLGIYEKIANSLDVEGNFSLLPAMADPVALAGGFDASIPAPSFPEGYAPYFAGLLVPKMAADLVKAGKTEFVVPVKLLEKLPSLASPPQPPAFEVPPKLPLPASVTVVSNSPTPGMERVPPVIPQNALSTLATIHVSAAEGIPKLIVQVIAKMPSILAKLPKIDEAIAEICGLVRDSGIFGEIKDSSTTQKAATIVLSRKTSECILINAIANTVGSAPGSLTSGIAGVTSDNSKGPDVDRYDAIPQELPPPRPDKPTPVQRALMRGQELAGTSYGNQDTRGAYVSGLFYIEDLLSRTPNVTINGTIPTEDPPLDVKSHPEIISIAKLSPEEQNKYVVENQTGFYDYAQDVARTASSCGLFVRSCYNAGGCINQYFLTMYPTSAAIAGPLYVGSLRNYRWIKDRGGNEGIIDALRAGYFYFQEDGSGTTDVNKAKTINDKKAEKIEININDILSVKVGDGQDNFSLYVDQDKVVPYQDFKTAAGKLLRAFLKPAPKRALITEGELMGIYLGRHPDYKDFPALKKGDAVLVRNPEHILLVREDRPAGYVIRDVKKGDVLFPGGYGELDPPIEGTDGGQADDQNYLDPQEVQAREGFADYSAADGAMKVAKAFGLPLPFANGKIVFQPPGTFKELTQVGTLQSDNATTWLWVDISKFKLAGQSTAIRNTKRNRGAKKDNYFHMGSEDIVTATGQVFKDGNLRPIVAIFKGENMLDPDENGEIVEGTLPERAAYITKEAYVASNIMDLTQGLASISSQLNQDSLENRVFPTLSAVEGGRKQNEALKKIDADKAAKK
jgi:hypothetical protein